jgi:hypothetical protein
MILRNILFAAGLVLVATTGFAQAKEFLTGPEVEQVREAQEPSDRLKLYAIFAKDRLDRIDKELAGKASDERGAAIHDLLYEYQRIIDALDDLADLAGVKRALVRKGLDAVVRAEPDFLKRLQALEEQNPTDRETYRFALTEAIDSTTSSLEDSKKLLAKQPAPSKRELEKEAKERAEEEKFEKEKEKAAAKKKTDPQ